MNPQKKRIEDLISVASIAALIIIPLLYVMRGLDVTDTGFVATNQRFFFGHPEHVSYWFHLYLTNLIGAVYDSAFGSLGIVSMKLASVAIFLLTATLIYKTYRGMIAKHLVLLIIAISSFFFFADKINIIHYNNLSALFCVAICYFLYAGFFEGKKICFIVAGSLVSIAFFTRLPNCLFGLLFFCVPKKITLRAVLLFALGALVAGAIVVGIMRALGHTQLYIDSLRSLFETTSNTETKYGSLHIVKRSARITIFAVLRAASFLLACGAAAFMAGFIPKRLPRLLALISLSAILPFAFRGFGVISITAGLSYILTIASLFLPDDGKKARLISLSLLGSCAIFFLSVGSDTGLDVSTYVFPFALPAMYAILTGLRPIVKGKSFELSKGLSVIFISCLVCLSVASFDEVYRDHSRHDSLATDSQIGWVLTGSTRARVLDSTIREIRQRIPEGSELLVWDSAGLIHYATNTLPWLDNPWPVLYGSDTANNGLLAEMLEKKAATGNLAPVLLAKKNPRGGGWPEVSGQPVFLDIITPFLEKNEYTPVWENDGFILYQRNMKK